jgi:hypothetical protein
MQPTFCFNLTHIFSKIFEQINWIFLIITSNPTIVMVFYIFQLTNDVYYYNGFFLLRMSFCYHNFENLALFPSTITQHLNYNGIQHKLFYHPKYYVSVCQIRWWIMCRNFYPSGMITFEKFQLEICTLTKSRSQFYFAKGYYIFDKIVVLMDD